MQERFNGYPEDYFEDFKGNPDDLIGNESQGDSLSHFNCYICYEDNEIGKDSLLLKRRYILTYM
ncbi:MAG: hypothetical protein K2I10_08105 [Lachnospiraceae bacterium]|nr:hypothetical protein [Lachnospiraceae bacterium]